MKVLVLIFLTMVVFISSFGCNQPTETKAITIIYPHLVSPYNGSTNISTEPLFKWTNSAHKIQLSLFPSFNNVIYSADISGNQYQMPSHVLQNGVTYYWRVGLISRNSTFWSPETYFFSTAAGN